MLNCDTIRVASGIVGFHGISFKNSPKIAVTGITHIPVYTVIIFCNTAFRNHNRAVFGRFIMAYRDDDSILDQIYEKQIFSAFYYEDSKF